MSAELDTLAAQIEAGRGGRLERNAPLASRTSFRVGGPADLLFEPFSADTLAEALAAAHRLGLPVTVLGGGTNILVADRGVRGLVVRLGREFDFRKWQVHEDGARASVEAGAATRLSRLVSEAVEGGWAGIEFAAGIPGTVGGGALMNAGAFGGEIGDAIERISAVTYAGEKLALERSKLRFSYRRLALDASLVVTSVRFGLLRSSVGRLKRVVESVQRKRKSKQPLGLPNAGSIFRNPPGTAAGRLIEQAGLKGRTIGRAQVSPEHANFIVNLGGARAADIRDLMNVVQEEVWQRGGVWLEPEVRLIGDWE